MPGNTAPHWAFEGYKLWQRIYDKRIVTSEGVYTENEVPEDYAGPELEIQFNQIMIFANDGGRFIEYRVMDYAELLDSDNKKGVGYTYELYGTTFSEEPTESSVKATWYPEKHPTNFSVSDAAKVDYLYKKYLEDRGDIAT